MAKDEKQPDPADQQQDAPIQLTVAGLAKAVFDAAGEAAAQAPSNDVRKAMIDFQRALIRLTGVQPPA